MKIVTKAKYAVFMLAGLMFVSTIAQASQITFGVQAPRGNAKTLKKWGELGKYLETVVGQQVKIVPLKANETMTAVKSGKVQFALTNPVLAVVLMKKNGSISLATMKKKTGHQLAGVIISKKGSGIKTADDLKGKKVMGFKFKKSAAAYVFQVKHLKDKGIDPHKDFKVFKEAKKQDDIVVAVGKGIMDAGFVKSGLLEAMSKEGKASMANFTIVDQKIDNFALLHTTELYPSWTVTVSPSIDKSLVVKVKEALLKIKANDKAGKQAKIVGFVEPVGLDDLANTLKELHLPPYQ